MADPQQTPPPQATSDPETETLSSAEVLRYGLRLMREVLPIRWKMILLTLVSIVGVAGFTGALANATKLIVDDVFGADAQGAALRVALIIVAVAIGKSFFQYVTEVLKIVLQRSVGVIYQKRLFAHVIQQELAFFGNQHATVQMVMVQLLGQGAGTTVANVCNRMLVETLTVIALFIVMLMQDPLLTLICSLCVPPILWLVSALSARVRAIATQDMALVGQFFSVGAEVLRGIKTVKSFQLEGKSVARFNRAMNALEKLILQFARVTSATIPIMEFLGGLVIAGFVVFASWQLEVTDSTPGTFTAFITAFLMAYQPAERLSGVWVEVQKSLVFVKRMYDMLDRQPQEKPYGTRTLPEAAPGVSLHDVSFGYGDGAPALKAVSFDIRPGERVAVVGKSGAGKSTLIDILQRFYDPQTGTVTLGGVPLPEISRDALYANIALISQEVFLFDTTLAENIAHGDPQASPKDIARAARIAQLQPLIDSLPDGLDTPVGPGGNALSGGQRQRLSIARGVAKRARLYIFDEVTSALDSANERAVMQAVTDGLPEATLIFVTHRASTLAYVDRVIVLEDGHVAGFDAPDRLMAENPAFRLLFEEPQDGAPKSGPESESEPPGTDRGP